MNNRLNCTLLRALPEMTEITGLPINSSIKGVHLCELLTASQTACFFLFSNHVQLCHAKNILSLH